jgi:beta-glucanase (GH16 family)
MSARISTKNHYSITYGRVEVRAKLPRGDWLWPAIWMLPNSGTWPMSGEIDIMEARGNGPEYAAQGECRLEVKQKDDQN